MAGKVMPVRISIVPVPGVKAKFVEDHVPLTINVPPLVMLMLLPETEELILLTFNLLVLPETQLSKPGMPFPTNIVP